MSTIIDIIMRLKDEASSEIGEVGSALDELKKAAAELFFLEDMFSQIKAAAVKMFPIDEAAAFQQSMAQVRATVGDISNTTFQELINKAREIGETTQFSASEAAGGLQLLAQAGLSADDAIAALPGTLQLAIAGGLDMANAADIATNVLSGMSLKIEDLARVNDVLAKAASSSNANVFELGEALKVAGPAAAASNESLEAATAVIGGLANAGIKGSEAGNAYKRMLTLLQDPSNEAKAALSRLGIETSDVDGKFRGIIPVLQDLGAKQISLTDATKIFGMETGAMAVAAANQAASIGTLRESLDNAEGSAARMAKIMGDTLMGSFKRFSSAVEALFINLGTPLLNVFKVIIDSASALISYIARFVDATGPVAPIIMSMAGAVGFLMAGITAAAGAFTAFNAISAILGLKTLVILAAEFIAVAGAQGIATAATWALNGALAINPFILAAIAIAGITAAVIALSGSMESATVRIDRQRQANYDSVASIEEHERNLKKLNDQMTAGEAVGGSYEKALMKLIEDHPELTSKVDITKASYADLFKLIAEYKNEKLIENLKLESAALNEMSKASKKVSEDYTQLGADAEFYIEIKRNELEENAKIKESQLELDKSMLKLVLSYKEMISSGKLTLESAQGMIDALEKEGVLAADLAKILKEKLVASYQEVKKETGDFTQQFLENTKKETEALIAATLKRHESFQKETKFRSVELDKQLAYIELAEARGVTSVEKASEQKIRAELKFLNESKDYYDERREILEGLYSEEIKKALEGKEKLTEIELKRLEEYDDTRIKIGELEANLTEKRAALANQTAKAQSKSEKEREQAVRDAAARIKGIFEEESSLREAQLKNQLAEINLMEARGVISHKEAAAKKREAEFQFQQWRIQQNIEAATALIATYQRDTDEYRKAVQEKIRLELQLQALRKNNEAEAARAASESASVQEKAADKTVKAAENVSRSAGAASSAMTGMSGAAETAGASVDKTAEKMDKFRDKAGGLSDSLKGFSADLSKSLADTNISVSGSIAKVSADVTAMVSSVSAEAARMSKAVNEQTFDQFIANSEEMIEKARESVNELIKQRDALRDKIKKTSDDIVSIEKSTAAMIADARAGDLSDQEKWLNTKEEAQTAYNEGIKAAASGEYEASKELFLKARDLAKKLLVDVEDFSDKIRGIEQTTVDIIRDLKQGLMDDFEKWNDDRMEAERLYDEAVKAMNEGQHERAAELFRQSQGLAKTLANEIKDGNGDVIASIEDTTTVAMEMVNKSGQGAVQAMSALSEQQTRIAQKANTDAIGLMEQSGNAASDALKKHVGEMSRQQKQIDASIAASQQGVQQLIKAVDKLVQSLNQKMEINVDVNPALAALQRLKNEAAKTAENLYYSAQKMMDTTNITQLMTMGGGASIWFAQSQQYKSMMGAADAASQKAKDYGYQLQILGGQAEKTAGSVNALSKSVQNSGGGTYNVNFTGTGSTTKPLTEKIHEIGSRFSSLAGTLNQVFEAKVDFMGDIGTGTTGLSDMISRIPNLISKNFSDIKIPNDFDNKKQGLAPAYQFTGITQPTEWVKITLQGDGGKKADGLFKKNEQASLIELLKAAKITAY